MGSRSWLPGCEGMIRRLLKRDARLLGNPWGWGPVGADGAPGGASARAPGPFAPTGPFSPARPVRGVRTFYTRSRRPKSSRIVLLRRFPGFPGTFRPGRRLVYRQRIERKAEMTIAELGIPAPGTPPTPGLLLLTPRIRRFSSSRMRPDRSPSAPNKPNIRRFWPKNADRSEKQTQSKPISPPCPTGSPEYLDARNRRSGAY